MDKSLVEQVAVKIEAETGLAFTGSKSRDLEKALPQMSHSLRFEQETSFVEWLLSAPWTKQKTEVCANHLTVAESYFFRESRAFDLVCDIAANKMAGSDPSETSLRLWSAGCCTGEEAYSIAIALSERFPNIDARQLFILATDISPQHLGIARAGRYRNWSMRSTTPALQQRYFARTDTGDLQIAASIRSLVRFKELNLAAHDYSTVLDHGGCMDIIFCRNVLMYFSTEQARRVIARLRSCLVDGGWLIVNPAEASAELYDGFNRVVFPDAIYFQKHPQPEKASEPGVRHAGMHLPAATPAVAVERAASARKSRPALTRHSSFDKHRFPAQPTACAIVPAASFEHTALVAIEAGDAQRAARALKAAIYMRPDSVLAYYWLGVVQLGEQQYESAIRQFNTVDLLLAGVPDDMAVPGSERFTAAYLRGAIAAFREKLKDKHGQAA